MSTLKKIFPYSFGADSIASLVIKTIVYICLPAILGIVITIIGIIPIIGTIIAWILGILSSVVGLYATVGIVILFLDYFKVLKD